jgi:outer membrane protein assembly factor BamE (lipoprotein component of BamABCDE complex)
MRKILIVLLAVGLVSGCATTKIGNTKIDDQGKYMQLEIGESDKRDVYLVFGQPAYVAYDKDSKSVWLYKRIDLTPSGWSYVPVWGLFVGGMNKEEKVAYFEFSESGKLKNVSSNALTLDEKRFINVKVVDYRLACCLSSLLSTGNGTGLYTLYRNTIISFSLESKD